MGYLLAFVVGEIVGIVVCLWLQRVARDTQIAAREDNPLYKVEEPTTWKVTNVA
jgi:hypothetical protein